MFPRFRIYSGCAVVNRVQLVNSFLDKGYPKHGQEDGGQRENGDGSVYHGNSASTRADVQILLLPFDLMFHVHMCDVQLKKYSKLINGALMI